jgi:hypothetical protein
VAWVEVFAVFVVCHLVGDYLFQTEWQATNKRGGLSGPPEAWRALYRHIVTYTVAFVPALVWIGDELGALEAVGLGALIAIPHLIQDDGRLVTGFIERVKGASGQSMQAIFTPVDQSFHMLALFGTALLAST